MKESPRSLITEEAAVWFATMKGDPPPEQRREFLQWLKRSQTHVAEYLIVVGIASDLERAVDSVVPHDDEREAMRIVWSLLATADDRDLLLWAEDTVPVAPRMEAAFFVRLNLPETTLKLMASDIRQRRLKRKERVWWALGILGVSILSPIAVDLFKQLVVR